MLPHFVDAGYQHRTAEVTFQGCVVVTSHVHYSRLSICCVEIWTCPQCTRKGLVSNVELETRGTRFYFLAKNGTLEFQGLTISSH